VEKALGIGGFFWRSRDPAALAKWYDELFGIIGPGDDYSQLPWQQQSGTTVFAPFDRDSTYFAADKEWMINLRVRDLDAMAEQLRAAGIEVKVDPEHYPNGRFARTHDPEGNAIELWQEETPPSS
jgi:glyoxylase I family protein